MRAGRRAHGAAAFAAALLLVAAAGCNLLLGNHDAPFVDGGASGSDAGPGGRDSTSGRDAPGADAGLDAPAVCPPDASYTGDPHNCGRCGHDCLGGGCDAGVCQPVALALDGAAPMLLAADPPFLYWVENTSGGSGAIMQCTNPSACSSVTQLAQGIGMPQALAAAGGQAGAVYWTDQGFSGEVLSCPAAGCTAGPQEIKMRVLGIGGLAVEGPLLYWGVNGLPGSVDWFDLLTTSTTGSTTSPSQPQMVVASGNWVAWGGAGGASVCPAQTVPPGAGAWCPTPAPATLSDASVNGVAIAGNVSLVWTDDNGVYVCPLPAGGSGTGGCDPAAAVPLGPRTTAGAVVADGTNAYWTNLGLGGSDLYWCPLSGCVGGGPKLLASGVADVLAMDTTALYWIHQTQIMMLVK